MNLVGAVHFIRRFNGYFVSFFIALGATIIYGAVLIPILLLGYYECGGLRNACGLEQLFSPGFIFPGVFH